MADGKREGVKPNGMKVCRNHKSKELEVACTSQKSLPEKPSKQVFNVYMRIKRITKKETMYHSLFCGHNTYHKS